MAGINFLTNISIRCCVWERDNKQRGNSGGQEDIQLQDTEGQEVPSEHRVHRQLQDGKLLCQDVLRLHQVQHSQLGQEQVHEGGQVDYHCKRKVQSVSINSQIQKVKQKNTV